MSPRRSPSSVAAAMLALVLALLAAAGCSNGDPALDSLRSDPMATADVDGMTDKQLFGQIGFTSLGKHEPATLTRLLRPADGRVERDDLRLAADTARAGGWRLREGDFGTWLGTKSIAGRPVDLLIRRSRHKTRVAVIMTGRP